MSAADKIAAARALIEPLRATVLWQNANPNVMKAADLLAALADLADAQAQQVTEWREEYRALQGMNELLQAANGKLIAEKDAQAQEIARLTAENEQLRKMLQPEWFYAADGYESEACRQSVWEVLDEHYSWDRPKTGQHVVEINVATSLPSIWAAVRFKCECDDPDECECDDNMIVTEHASEAEARAALGETP